MRIYVGIGILVREKLWSIHRFTIEPKSKLPKNVRIFVNVFVTNLNKM